MSFFKKLVVVMVTSKIQKKINLMTLQDNKNVLDIDPLAVNTLHFCLNWEMVRLLPSWPGSDWYGWHTYLTTQKIP